MANNKNKKNEARPEAAGAAADVNASVTPEELAELRKKAAASEEYHDNWLRTLAEYDNARKRMERERSDHVKYANRELIAELINILDDFERGIRAAEQKKDFDQLHKGVDMILNGLHQLLEERGLKKIKCGGEKFDPYKHEAVEVVPGEPSQDGIIAEELQSGYELNGQVIRPAKVRVVKSAE